MTLSSPATERNKQPILQVLKPFVAQHRIEKILEIGSLFGQHGKYFCQNIPEITWQPTDVSKNLNQLSHCLIEKPENIFSAQPLDVTASEQWHALSGYSADMIFSANTLHIMPWSAVECIFTQLKTFPSVKFLMFYGPFFIENVETAPSNLAFDMDLKSRILGSGIRKLEEICILAKTSDFEMTHRHPMPANNQILIFERAL